MWCRSTSEGRTSCNQCHRWTVRAGGDRRPRSPISTRVARPTTRACAIRLIRRRSRRSSRLGAPQVMMSTASGSVPSSLSCGEPAFGSAKRSRSPKRTLIWARPISVSGSRKNRSASQIQRRHSDHTMGDDGARKAIAPALSALSTDRNVTVPHDQYDPSLAGFSRPSRSRCSSY